MKTIDEAELIYFTVLTFLSALSGLFMISATNQLLTGMEVTLFADFFRALCIAFPFAVAFYVMHRIIFRMRAGSKIKHEG